MQTFKQYLIEGDVSDAESRLKQASERDRGPGMGRSSREELNRAKEETKKLRQQKKRDEGEVKTVRVNVPSVIASDLHHELLSMWKGSSVHPIPWQNLGGGKKGVTVVAFTDYTPGDKKDGVSVEKLIKHVKKYAV